MNKRKLTYDTLSWKNNFELNLLGSSIICSLLGVGLFFLETEATKIFIYCFFSLGIMAFFNSFFVGLVGNYLDEKEELEIDTKISNYALGLSSLSILCWSLGLLFHFINFNGIGILYSVVLIIIACLSILGIVSSVFHNGDNVHYSL